MFFFLLYIIKKIYKGILILLKKLCRISSLLLYLYIFFEVNHDHYHDSCNNTGIIKSTKSKLPPLNNKFTHNNNSNQTVSKLITEMPVRIRKMAFQSKETLIQTLGKVDEGENKGTQYYITRD